MRKYNNPRLLNTVVSGTGMRNPVRPHVIISDTVNEFVKGDLMEANAISELVDQKVGSVESATETNLTELKQALAEETAARTGADQALDERITDLSTSIPQAISDGIAEVVAGADADYDTLKEISDYIQSDKTGAAQLNNAVSDNAAAIIAERERAIAKETQLQNDVDQKADQDTTYTKTEVDTLINGVYVSDQLANYYTKTEIDNAGYLTEHQDISNKADKSELFSRDYNDLTNKPVIPIVPTNVSAFTNDSNYQTQQQVDDRFTALINAAPAALDTLGEIADKLSDNDDAVSAIVTSISNEVDAREAADIAITTNINELATTVSTNNTTINNRVDALEASLEDRISDVEDAMPTKVSELTNDAGYLTQHQSLDNYYTKAEVDSSQQAQNTEISSKADKSTTYTKTEVDNLVAPKANASDVYSKTEADSTFIKEHQSLDEYAKKTELIDAYSKTETNELLANKANSADLAIVATTGSYDDLTNKPTIPAAQIQSDWNQTDTSAKDYIWNKPTKVSEFQNDAEYLSLAPDANSHEYVDLGLPSGTLWATMNVGATSETGYGLYFQWGDTQGYTASQVGSGEGQKKFTWDDYKYRPYQAPAKYNATDSKTILDLEDDAARANWGGSWKMPTMEQLQELLNTNYCTKASTTVNGVNGYLFTSVTNGNTLFIPTSGYAGSGGFQISPGGSTGYVWSSSLGNDYSVATHNNVWGSYRLQFNTAGYGIDIKTLDRFYGLPVRGVLNSKQLHPVAFSGDYNDLENNPTNVSEFTNDVGYLTTHQDISGKQDVITDLATIRSGAAAGSTAYQKPSDGINISDLALSVQNALTAANTAVQYQDANYQNDINGKVDKTTTVNNHALSSNVTITKSDVGLGNVTNDAQVKRSEMGTANGVATLDSNGLVPSSQLPSYVDDVLEYTSKSKFPSTGQAGKIYVDTTTNLTYRWSGTAYTEISPSIALGETSSTAYAGNKGKALADKLNTIEEGAQVNVNADWNATSGDAQILNKPTIPTKTTLGLNNVANIDQSKAIKSITRSGNVFTYTCLDNTTGTFTQQPNTDITVADESHHYKPSGNTLIGASLDGTAGTYAVDTNYTVLTGIHAVTDSRGHVTELTYTAQNIKDTDTKNTAGATNTSSKLFLIGATKQSANPQTYSQDTAYVGTDGCLYSGSKKVLTEHQSQSMFVGTCTTAADVAAKVATVEGVSDFELNKGVIVCIKFTYSNTFSATEDDRITLNVNNTGAKPIYYNISNANTGTNTTAYGYANMYFTYMYDGTNWVWINCGVDANTSYKAGTNAQLVAGTSTSSRIWSPAVLHDYISEKADTMHRRTRIDFTSNGLEWFKSTLKSAIADVSLEKYGLRVGDYCTATHGGKTYNYIIAGLNTMKGSISGSTLNYDHVGIIVDTNDSHVWNTSDTTTASTNIHSTNGTWRSGTSAAGYANCDLQYYLETTVLPNVESDLGSDNIKSHTKTYSNAVNTSGYNRSSSPEGCSSSCDQYQNQKICALSEVQVYGSIVWSSSGYDTGEACRQLDVFRVYNTGEIFQNRDHWLRDVASSSLVCCVTAYGIPDRRYAKTTLPVAALILFA